ncbi:LysM peptidoglycan-binding domain-containing protein [soil metagenome]
MKKFSTATRLLALASFLVPLASIAADAEIKDRATSRCEFLPNAPDQHTVVRGDTLWGISGKFLERPWCWAQVWGMNKDQIRDPHWIYPGQVVYLDRAAGKLRLGSVPGQVGVSGLGSKGSGSEPGGDIKLSPQKRMEALGLQAIQAIPTGVIEPFLTQPLIVDERELSDRPRIVATPEGRVNVGSGDKVYVLGDLDGGTSFQAFRPGMPIKDPISKALLGYEAIYLGTLKLIKDGSDNGEAHTMVVIGAKEEMGVGDRLIPVKPTPFLNYVPHSPRNDVDARVIGFYSGALSNAGQNQIISINRGEDDAIDRGTVLDLYRTGPIIADRTDGKKPVKLPDEQYGRVFIFRVFGNISYGLVMQVRDTVQIGDSAKSPE